MRIILGCVLLGVVIVMVRPAAADDKPAVLPVVTANTKFACDLYGRLAGGDSNLVLLAVQHFRGSGDDADRGSRADGHRNAERAGAVANDQCCPEARAHARPGRVRQ